ncbi:polyribonucleotide nucleotidyltransferase [Candidatus Daviesbacteria bacterium RIFCSPLOWO2_02_FULL_36_8]|uniref:Polyribonucleotide nucleotidyltransferase n=1 Tax=Candidatus Daviesbacteria bacterium RIFCSPLOWO2_02_FULL_36_8 TaxID=1797793 RepID=A0A1F5MGA6_9BACT|nr:MAG: polyribonucleotide nucleotidyltransferase [Candidatus Daviesbacteria bacterium RIFCSPLOWO2_02_FULL_36_8]
MSKVISKEIDLNGRKLRLETGKLAQQADASVVVSWGETVILATVATQPLKADIGYFPLSVEYVEKHYAGGKISSSKFIKREARPTDEAVLTGRLVDRSIRPLFPKEFKMHEVQVILTVLSYDPNNDPDVAALIGASAALSISSVPFKGPIAGVRIGAVRPADGGKDWKLIPNPSLEEMEHLDMDLLVASGKEKIVMIETGAKQVDDALVFEGIKEAFKEAQQIISLIEEFTKVAGKEKQVVSHLEEEIEEALLAEVSKITKERIEAALFDNEHPWHEATGDLIKRELAVQYKETITEEVISGIFDKVAKEILHETVLEKQKRVDGRAMEEVRKLDMEAGILPRTHGSALFQRGDTQVLSVTTLGAPSLEQTLDGMEGERKRRFMHHYNMSINPFSVGEVKRLGSPNRRDIGHGALVEKAILPIIPTQEDFPYAIRVVSEVLAANASTSQAAICATSLALLNAGVPVVAPVAGIAMGLFSNATKTQVVTDMRAVEDFYGEMDFKVAGTKNGVTAIQMDTKLEGLTFEIIEEALKQGKRARIEILEAMEKVIPSVGPLSPHAPRVEILHIKPEEIGMLIGPGGKNINGIIAKTGAGIDIEDDGTVMVSGTDSAGVDKAIEAIQGMFKTFTVGEELTGKVVRLAPFGAFVELSPGKDGLVHISQMAPGRVENAADVVSEGQEVKVRVTDVTPEGKIGLSMLFGADIKPESESKPSFSSSRPSGGGGFTPRFGGGADRPRPGFSDRPRRPFGARTGSGGRSSGGGFGRGGGRDRGGRGGFDR